MVDFTGKFTENPTHVQTVDTRPFLPKRAAWVEDILECAVHVHLINAN